MNFGNKFSIVSIVLAMVVLPLQLVMALSIDDIRRKAEQVTVRIDGSSESNQGSGVIIDRQGVNPFRYKILTNWHVVKGAETLTVEIPGVGRYPVGCRDIREVNGADLAVLTVPVNQWHATVVLGNSGSLRDADPVYVSGWANPDRTNRERRYLFRAGKISEILKIPRNNAYTLVYDNDTRPGMSGGPVLNDKRELVGINGSAESNPQPKDFLGIPINTFSVWNQRFGNSPSPGSCRSARSTTPPRPAELTGFPKQKCGGVNQPGLQTWYPVFVDYSDRRIRQIQARFCRDAFPNDRRDRNRTYIQVASFRDRSVAEEFARIMRTEFGSGEVGELYRK